MILKATGVSGRVGAERADRRSTLPQRAFHNPLARALVEQRRDARSSTPTTSRRESPRRSTR